LAVATLVDHDFRSDDFALNGTFVYDFRAPANNNYIDRINNGTYASSSGHVDWTSPTQGAGFFEGTAIGTGKTTVLASLEPCSTYGIQDNGRLDFALDTAISDLNVTQANATSTVYTSFVDHTPFNRSCWKQDPPWSRFFGGDPTLYNGTFKSSDHSVTVSYLMTGATPMTVTSPSAVIQWTNSTATDLTVAGASYYSAPSAPAGWQSVSQTTTVKPVTTIDPEVGGVTVNAAVTGKVLKTATPATPLANVRLFWASSATDTTGAEIPVTSNSDPVGLYWNSSQMMARIESLPTPPASATHLRVAVSGPAGSDSAAANSVAFLPLGLFEAAGRTTGPVTAGGVFDGSSLSLLATADLANPDIRVFAYNPLSQAGGQVNVANDLGGFTYNSAGASALVSLADGEMGSDTIEYLAIKNQTVLDRATHTITVIGVNDAPIAGNDTGATNNQTRLTLASSNLLANDVDPDHNDQVRLVSANATSSRGGTVRLIRNALTNSIDSIEYDPTTSAQLRSLALGAQLVDLVTYTIRDELGLEDEGIIQVTVTGTTPSLLLATIPSQLTRVDTPVGPLSVGVFDPDGDPSDLQLTVTAANPTLIPPGNLQLTGTGETRSLVITPAAGLFGKTMITVQATDGAAQQASTSFLLIVGTAGDLDLDGIADAIEDAAPHGGDMNSDGLLDRTQPNVVSIKSAHGNNYFLLLTNEPNAFEQIAVRDGSTDPAAPADMSLPLGVTHVELVIASGTTAQAAFRTNLTSPPVNRLLQQKPLGAWKSGMLAQMQGAELQSSGHLLMTLRDGGLLDANATVDQRVTFEAGFAHADFPWLNDNPLDVTNDGVIAPIDALSIINELNGIGARPLPPIPQGTMTIPTFLDPNGDNFVSPVDALLVINWLNGLVAGEGEDSRDAALVLGAGALAAEPTPAANDESRAAALAAIVQELDQPGGWANDANVVLPTNVSAIEEDDSESKASGPASAGRQSLEPFSIDPNA